MSRIVKRGAKAPEMNMTPLIDVTFQLILFFMLVNNIIAEESIQMIVPRLENPNVRELGETQRIIVNVAPIEDETGKGRANNPLDWADGRIARIRVGSLQEWDLNRDNITLPQALEEVTKELKGARAKNPEIEVVLRADSALHYQEVQPVIEAITMAEIATINLVAYMEEE